MAGAQVFDLHVVVDPETQPELLLAVQLVQLLSGGGGMAPKVTPVSQPVAEVPELPPSLVHFVSQFPTDQRLEAEWQYRDLVRAREAANPSGFVTEEVLREFFQTLHASNKTRIGKSTHSLWGVYGGGRAAIISGAVLEYVIHCTVCGITVTGSRCEQSDYKRPYHRVLAVSVRSIVEQHQAFMRWSFAATDAIGPKTKEDADTFVRHLGTQQLPSAVIVE